MLALMGRRPSSTAAVKHDSALLTCVLHTPVSIVLYSEIFFVHLSVQGHSISPEYLFVPRCVHRAAVGGSGRGQVWER